MRTILLTSFLIIAMLLLWSCSRQVYTLSKLPGEYLVFGSGGGFTGAVDAYYLFPNGQVIHHNSLKKDTVALPTVKRGFARKAMKKAASIDWPTDLNEPGNLYKFIRWYGREGQHAVTWGAANYEPPAELTALFVDLQGLLPSKANKE